MAHERRAFLWPAAAVVLLAAFAMLAARGRDRLLPAAFHTAQELSVQIFECGYGEISDVSTFSSGEDRGVSQPFVVPCYLIRHPRGTLFWDAGLPDSLVNLPDGWAPGSGNVRFRVKKTLVSQLDAIGFSPTAVTYLGLSHTHYDHVGNAHLFASATLLIQDAEYRAAFSDSVLRTSTFARYYEKLRANATIRLDGDHDVFGDSSVVILTAPGHTPGHQVLFLRLPQTGPVVLSGDLYHFAKNRQYRRMPVSNFDRDMTLRSMDRVESFLTRMGATLWIQHDVAQNATLPYSPAVIR